ncbi:unnamed protein product [Peniophora sp. CBMAI 1063]|nr:unnamed protein product [Peniophora sp. CBMAI 1063]
MNFYFQAAGVLDRLGEKRGSVKGLIAALPEKDRKRTAALVIETLKYKPVLADTIAAAQLHKHERKLNSANLALVLVHDALLASGGIQAGDGPLKQAVLRHKTRLNSELQRIKIKRGVSSNAELAASADARAASIPRYVRINTLKWSLEEALRTLESQGFKPGSAQDLQPREYAKDEHIPNLLLFHPQTTFQDDAAYTAGKLILQDKASCFPATVLSPPVHDRAAVIDATAAPGNKTSQLSALMKGKGTLMAFERDRRRFGTLQTMLGKAGCPNTTPLNADFLTTDPKDERFASISHILLDPSCSGSGIVNRLDYLMEPEDDSDGSAEQARLEKLASFQLLIIRHAMKFPAARKIVYSTCSVHNVENEQVVKAALASEEAIDAGWTLAPRSRVLPSWPRRGHPDILADQDATNSVVRCEPGEDATNGFFVACFERSADKKRKAEHNEDDAEHIVEHDQAPAKKKRKKKKKKSKPAGAPEVPAGSGAASS